jgi:dextranase
LEAIRALIAAAHQRGIAALPYTAVYAASPEFYRAHQEWALFKADGQPLDFANGFLIYMNPAENSPWSRHLLDEFDTVLRTLNFDGIHIDQYGDPIAARNALGEIVMLDRAFRAFVDAAARRVKAVRPDATIVFNCVGNWPIEHIAGSQADLMYIEVWKPHTQWRDLRWLISEAQRLSRKAVVLAAYIDPAREHNVRLANAIIFASGGNHIELGEPDALLADPYFPRYGRMRTALSETLRAYYDFAVRYENVLALNTWDVSPEWTGCVIIEDVATDWQQARDVVWPIVRSGAGFTAISLINLLGLASAHWTDPLPGAPTRLGPLAVKVYADRPVARAWWASPDGDSSQAVPASAQTGRDTRGNYLSLALPGLAWWTLIILEWES